MTWVSVSSRVRCAMGLKPSRPSVPRRSAFTNSWAFRRKLRNWMSSEGPSGPDRSQIPAVVLDCSSRVLARKHGAGVPAVAEVVGQLDGGEVGRVVRPGVEGVEIQDDANLDGRRDSTHSPCR